MKRSASNIAIILAAAALSGCSIGSLGFGSGKGDTDVRAYATTVDPADVLYNQGLANLESGRLKEAARKFEAVDRQHPYSEFARRALVMNAFTEYRRGRYDDAIGTAKRYLNLYPASNDAAYAQYIVGLSHFKQIPDVTRDLRPARDAVRAFGELKERFPDSEYVQDADSKLLIARDQIAGKEMQTGRYYQERREYTAAVNRYKNVVKDYANTRHVEEALARLVESYMALGLTGEAQDAASILGHNFPDSEWYRDSYALLAKDGVRPRANPGSTLARAIGLSGG